MVAFLPRACWLSMRTTGRARLYLEPQARVPVDVLVEQVAEGAGSAGVAGLGTEGAQPHVVAGLDLHPVGVEQVDTLALQHVEPVFHHMCLRERDGPARL